MSFGPEIKIKVFTKEQQNICILCPFLHRGTCKVAEYQNSHKNPLMGEWGSVPRQGTCINDQTFTSGSVASGCPNGYYKK